MQQPASPTFVLTDKSAGKMFLLTMLGIYLVSYVIRFFYLDHFVSQNITLLDVNPDWNVILPRPLRQGLLICSAIFGLFFFISMPWNAGPVRTRVAYLKPAGWFQLGLISFIAFCIAMRFIYGAKLGEQLTSMPLGLSSPINRSISELIPGLILLMMEAFWFTGDQKNYRRWLFVLAAFNLSIAAIATSKAGMVFFAAEWLMFMYLTGQPIIRKPLRWIVLGLLVLAAFIIGSQLRAQSGGNTSDYVVLLQQGDYAGTLLLALGTFINRLIGLDGYALVCGYDCATLPGVIALNTHSFFGEAGRIYTQEVVRVTRDFDYRSPGLLGGAALLAGSYGGAMLAIGFLRGCLALIRVSDRLIFSIAFKISIVFGLFRFVLEGTWAGVDLIALVIGAFLIETGSRLLDANRRSGVTQPQQQPHSVN